MKLKPQHLVIGLVLVVFAAIIIPSLGAEQPGMLLTEGDSITQTIGVIETDAEATFAIQMQEGGDAAHESTHVFDTLEGAAGVGKATFDTETLQLVVTYDSQATDEAAIRARLAQSGYVAATLDDATQTEVAADGSVQTLTITDEGYGFDPNFIRAAAGVPFELTFGPGTECRVQVKFPALGVQADLTQGAVVELPALEPGEYEMHCSGDAVEGVIVVE